MKCGCTIYFILNSANVICQSTDISKYFRESLGLRDNESRLYLNICLELLEEFPRDSKTSLNQPQYTSHLCLSDWSVAVLRSWLSPEQASLTSVTLINAVPAQLGRVGSCLFMYVLYIEGLTLVVILYEIYATCLRRFFYFKFHMKWPWL